MTSGEPVSHDWLEGNDQGPQIKACVPSFSADGLQPCVSDFANKVRTDVTMADGGFRFHVGTPLPDLRQIASWMITHAPKQRVLARTIPALWNDTAERT